MKKELLDKYAQAEATGEKVDIGEIVVCDRCNKDYTDSNESGGFIFSSSAYCSKCATEALKIIKGYGEEHFIRARCDDKTSFADFVRAYRGADNYIQITGFK